MQEVYQVELLKKIKSHFLKLKSKNLSKYSYLYYLSPNSNLGSLIVKSFIRSNKNFFNYSKTIVKEIFYSLNYINYKTLSHEIDFSYKKIMITWAFENDFKKDGSFFDRYFKINSNKLKNTLWVVVYKGNNLPRRVKNNIFIIKPEESKSLNILPIIKLIFTNLYFVLKDKNLFLSSVSNHNFFANIFLHEVKNLISHKVELILMAYEGQTFQNRLISFISKEFKNIKTIGYVHSPPMAIPSNFFFKKSSPDKIILSGKDQIYCFTKYLGWKKSKIIFLPSFRFNKSKININIKSKIYLPLSVVNKKRVFESLKILHEKKYFNVKKAEIKSHPASVNTKSNNKLVQELKKFIKSLNNKPSSIFKKNTFVFVGISGAIVESLESGFKVIQISDDPILDTYSKNLWPTLMREKIHENIFSYKLKKKQNLIKLGSLSNNLKNLTYIKKKLI